MAKPNHDVQILAKDGSATMVSPMSPAIESASLQLAAEFLRRYPQDYSVYETHSCDGQYDCLSVLGGPERSHVFDFNRMGRIHLFQSSPCEDTRPIDWKRILEEADFGAVLDQISAWAGRKKPEELPESNAKVLCFRLMAFASTCLQYHKQTFSFRQAYGHDKLTHDSGYLDYDSMNGWSKFEQECERSEQDPVLRILVSFAEDSRIRSTTPSAGDPYVRGSNHSRVQTL